MLLCVWHWVTVADLQSPCGEHASSSVHASASTQRRGSMETFHYGMLGPKTSCGTRHLKKDVNESVSFGAAHTNRLCSSCLSYCSSDLTTFINRRSLQGL